MFLILTLLASRADRECAPCLALVLELGCPRLQAMMVISRTDFAPPSRTIPVWLFMAILSNGFSGNNGSQGPALVQSEHSFRSNQETPVQHK